MSQVQKTLRQTDLTRALRGAVAAGIEVARIEIDWRTGSIVISTPKASSVSISAYDDWKGQQNAG